METNLTLKFKKIRDVKSPTRSGFDSGIDFYIPNKISDLIDVEGCKFTPSEYINEENQKMMKQDLFNIDKNEISIPFGYGILIPSGLQSELPNPYDEKHCTDLVFEDKSGVCSKLGLIVGACVIDNKYRGEIHIHLINTTPFNVTISGGQKIVQGIVRGVYLLDLLEVNEINTNTDRGEGGFGSTGN